MSCKMDINLIYSYCDKSIEPLEEIFVEEHLKYCLHCQKELELISRLDVDLKEALFDIEFPERLSLLSQLIAENSIEQINNAEVKGLLRSSVDNYFSINKFTYETLKVAANNPFSNFISSGIGHTVHGVNKSLGFTVKVLKKPMKRMLKSKLQDSNLLNIFKLG